MATYPSSLRRKGTPPTVGTLDASKTDAWFQQMHNQSLLLKRAGPPTANTLPDGAWCVCWDSTANTVKVYANKSGTIVASAAFV